MYTNAFGTNLFADMLDIFADLIHMVFRVKPSGYTNKYGETVVADIEDMGATTVHLFIHNFVLFLAIAVIGFAWRPLIMPTVQNLNLLNPAPPVVSNPGVPAVIVVPSQTETLTATPSPTETMTPAPTFTPSLTPTITLTPTKTPIPPMEWGEEVESYIAENCMWFSKAEGDALLAANPNATIEDIPQAKAILAVYPDASLGILDTESEEKWVCIFSPSLESFTGQYGFIFVNAEWDVVSVPVKIK